MREIFYRDKKTFLIPLSLIIVFIILAFCLIDFSEKATMQGTWRTNDIKFSSITIKGVKITDSNSNIGYFPSDAIHASFGRHTIVIHDVYPFIYSFSLHNKSMDLKAFQISSSGVNVHHEVHYERESTGGASFLLIPSFWISILIIAASIVSMVFVFKKRQQ